MHVHPNWRSTTAYFLIPKCPRNVTLESHNDRYIIYDIVGIKGLTLSCLGYEKRTFLCKFNIIESLYPNRWFSDPHIVWISHRAARARAFIWSFEGLYKPELASKRNDSPMSRCILLTRNACCINRSEIFSNKRICFFKTILRSG